MADCMTFPDTVEEFMEQYKVVDTERVYTNGTEFVPIYRMKQWFEHLSPTQRKKGHWLPDNNCYYETRYICSECKLPFHVETVMMIPSWRFCPNCGARMVGENDA